MAYKIESVTKPLLLGEGPHWDIPSQTLYFVDIVEASVNSYKPSTNEHHSAIIGDGKLPVSLIIPVEGEKDTFVISIKNQLAVITWDGKSSTTSTPEVIATPEPQDGATRLNDGKCDANGRIWTGTMLSKGSGDDGITFDPVGSLYMVHNKVVKKQLGNICIANGLTWRPDNKKFYYIDSLKCRVDSYDFDIQSGTISNEKTVFSFKEHNIPSVPDGMTVDTEGKLYIANFAGSQILRVDPETGELIEQIKLPALQITSAAFGGPNLDELYVTTANLDNTTYQPLRKENGSNGCVLRISNLGGIKGAPMANVKL